MTRYHREYKASVMDTNEGIVRNRHMHIITCGHWTCQKCNRAREKFFGKLLEFYIEQDTIVSCVYEEHGYRRLSFYKGDEDAQHYRNYPQDYTPTIVVQINKRHLRDQPRMFSGIEDCQGKTVIEGI